MPVRKQKVSIFLDEGQCDRELSRWRVVGTKMHYDIVEVLSLSFQYCPIKKESDTKLFSRIFNIVMGERKVESVCKKYLEVPIN